MRDSNFEKYIVEQSIKSLNLIIKSIELDELNKVEPTIKITYTLFNKLVELYEMNGVKDGFRDKKSNIIKENLKLVSGENFKCNRDELKSFIQSNLLKHYKNLKNLILLDEIYGPYGMDVDYQHFHTLKQNNYFEKLNIHSNDIFQNYWKKIFGDKIDTTIHHAYEYLTGYIEPRIISQKVLNKEIFPFFNSSSSRNFYNDKNSYDLLFDEVDKPISVIKRVNNQYFNSANHPISRSEAFKIFFKLKEDVIVKNSLADDGKSVEKIKYNNHNYYLNNKKIELGDIEKIWGNNLVIQKVIKQHPIMSAPHPASVNTFRIVTLRWNNEIHYLLSYAKFGANGEPKDNGGEGGVLVAISSDGKFNSYGYNANLERYYEHPTTKFKFKDLKKFPHFDKFIDLTKKLHEKVLHLDYISWDIAAGFSGDPIFIEMNFRGTVWRAQLVTEKPVFGELTDEILNKVNQSKKISINS